MLACALLGFYFILSTNYYYLCLLRHRYRTFRQCARICRILCQGVHYKPMYLSTYLYRTNYFHYPLKHDFMFHFVLLTVYEVFFQENLRPYGIHSRGDYQCYQNCFHIYLFYIDASEWIKRFNINANSAHYNNSETIYFSIYFSITNAAYAFVVDVHFDVSHVYNKIHLCQKTDRWRNLIGYYPTNCDSTTQRCYQLIEIMTICIAYGTLVRKTSFRIGYLCFFLFLI